MVTVIGGSATSYERVNETLEWLEGQFVGFETRVNDKKQVTDSKTGERKIVSQKEVKFLFTLLKYNNVYKTKWMKISMNEKSNLFSLIILGIDPSIMPNSLVDIDKIIGDDIKIKEYHENDVKITQKLGQNGLKAKFMFAEKKRIDGQGMFQYVDKIKLLEGEKPQILLKMSNDTINNNPSINDSPV